jgi:hypothetical protein
MTFATTLSRVAALCLLAGVAHASPVPAADSRHPVPATVYRPALPFQAAALEPASPDRAWREQNRIVGATHSMMPAMGGHGADAHAGHTMAAPDTHAGHGAMHVAASLPMATATGPHAGHRMHAGHAADGKAAPLSGSGCCKDGCCKDGSCCGAADAGAGMGGCCAKGGADAPPSCAPALPAAGAPPAHHHQHGGQP